MSVGLGAIMTGIKTTLAGISGLNTYDVWTLSPATPFAMPRFLGDSQDEFEGGATAHIEIVFGVAASDLPTAQRALYALASRTGSGSILVALEAAPTLGGVVESVTVLDMAEGFTSAEIGAAEYLIGKRPVDVLYQPG